MHYCPECGEECDCGCDYEKDSNNCEHVCKTPEETEYYEDFYDNYDPFEDLDNYDDEDF